MKTWEAIQTFISGVFPNAVAINSTGAGTQDGTEYIAEQINNGLFGPTQALMDYASLTPDGVTEAAGASQLLEAIRLGHGIGPGIYKQWGKFDDPSVTGDRVLLLSGQGILIASFTALVSACYVGDGNNATALFFYKSVLADGVTRDIAGPFFILPDSRNYVLPFGPRTTQAFWHTVDGYGSSSTRIQKFSTEVLSSDDVVVTVVNSATLGFTVTANVRCRISVAYSPNFNAVGLFGFSLNSAQLTTGIDNITAADRLTIGTAHAANNPNNVAISRIIEIGDVVRPHTSGVANGSTAALGSITVFAEELPLVNSASIMGITF